MRKIPLLATAMPAAIFAIRAQAPQSANQMMQELTAAFGDFRTNYDQRLEAQASQIDQLVRQGAAANLNGSHAGMSPASRTAIEAFGRFASRGSAEGMPSAAMRSGSDPDGGYMVTDEVSSEILNVQRDLSPMRRLARVVQTNSGSYSQIMGLGGAGSGWVGDTESRPETATPKFSEMTYPAFTIYAQPAVTQDLLEDADFNVGQYLSEELGREFDVQEGATFITGNGVKKPRGVLSYDTFEVGGAETFGDIGFVKSGHASSIPTCDPLVDVLQSMKAAYRRNATWLMNSKTQGAISKFKDTTGQYIWQRALTAGAPDLLLGRPVELDENMPDVAAGAFPIALGDWKRGYLINDRRGMTILRDPFTAKPFVRFYSTKRVGGGLLDSNAIRLLKVAA